MHSLGMTCCNMVVALEFHGLCWTGILEHDPVLQREEFLLFGEHIDDLHFIANVISLVFGISDHIEHSSVGNLVAVVITVAFLPKDGFDLLHRVLPGDIQL